MPQSLGSPRILLVDSYDSFTHNLAALCKRSIPNCNIHIIKNDQLTQDELLSIIPYFSAIIVGPGPGSPQNDQDIGIVKNLWKLDEEHILPIFGVCLGLQSLCVEYGAHLKKLKVVKHGQVSPILHQGMDIFQGVGHCSAVRYHSLHVELKKGGQIQQLAWADDGNENGPVVMAVRHTLQPYWSVQYHPESVCTDHGGLSVLSNFWRLAQAWATQTNRFVLPWDDTVIDIVGPSWPNLRPHTPPPSRLPLDKAQVTTRALNLPDLPITTICELLGSQEDANPFVLLDSAAQPGRFSIVASLTTMSPQITYHLGDDFVCIKRDKSMTRISLGAHDIWTWLASFMRDKRADGGLSHIPFWGGLVGYLTYELGVCSLPVPKKQSLVAEKLVDDHADANFLFVERSIVLDSATGNVFLQSLLSDDDEWFAHTSALLERASQNFEFRPFSPSPKRRRTVNAVLCHPSITLPNKTLYKSRINLAKEHLFDGDSYELCLTAHTHVSLPPISTSVSSSWERYKSLRINNPAPHSAYLRLHPTTLLSSSPERFLSFSRPSSSPSDPGTLCQLRPIKGTVRKSPKITRALAEAALSGSKKEVAENLMIVDLIRHDLYGVLGEDVHVRQFCKVEEYETVWQLVSVVEGRLGKENAMVDDGELGWQVLRRCLPPGSMTGAPKKRSVEILQTLEDDRRSLYSGVFGYWCVGGSGDFSVTIRSCFKFDDQGSQESGRAEEWVIGAGGAITALSDPDAEWEEMIIKLSSVLRAFGVADDV